MAVGITGINHSSSVNSLKTELKKYFINQYNTDLQVSGFYYVSKISLCNMRITVSKMHTFHIPPYLPARIPRVSKIQIQIHLFLHNKTIDIKVYNPCK